MDKLNVLIVFLCIFRSSIDCGVIWLLTWFLLLEIRFSWLPIVYFDLFSLCQKLCNCGLIVTKVRFFTSSPFTSPPNVSN